MCLPRRCTLHLSQRISGTAVCPTVCGIVRNLFASRTASRSAASLSARHDAPSWVPRPTRGARSSAESRIALCFVPRRISATAPRPSTATPPSVPPAVRTPNAPWIAATTAWGARPCAQNPSASGIASGLRSVPAPNAPCSASSPPSAPSAKISQCRPRVRMATRPSAGRGARCCARPSGWWASGAGVPPSAGMVTGTATFGVPLLLSKIARRRSPGPRTPPAARPMMDVIGLSAGGPLAARGAEPGSAIAASGARGHGARDGGLPARPSARAMTPLVRCARLLSTEAKNLTAGIAHLRRGSTTQRSSSTRGSSATISPP
mmetsp:Transcript_1429/g.3061  ORF Transcript_1429/g.3061 Transcript_1429/m.3061 type:complete len:320 (+) Transcript_1429:397-1356(+)